MENGKPRKIIFPKNKSQSRQIDVEFMTDDNITEKFIT